MADDILLSPEEQDERARQWLKDNGLALALGIGLGLGGVFGYQQWQAKLASDAESAAAIFNRTLTAVQASDLSDISENVETLKREYKNSPYAVKASLLRAKQLSVSDLSAAAKELQWAAGHAEEAGLKHAAQIRLAKVLTAQGELEKAKSIATDNMGNGFDSNYAEILGDIARLQNDIQTARTHYQSALDNLSQADGQYSAILNLKLNRLPSFPAVESEKDANEDVSAGVETLTEKVAE